MSVCLSDLSPEAKYRFRVQAKSNDGTWSEWSEALSWRAPLLPSVQDLSITGIETGLPVLTWTPIHGTVLYRVELKENDSFTLLGVVSEPRYELKVLNKGHNYEVRVSAVLVSAPTSAVAFKLPGPAIASCPKQAHQVLNESFMLTKNENSNMPRGSSSSTSDIELRKRIRQSTETIHQSVLAKSFQPSSSALFSGCSSLGVVASEDKPINSLFFGSSSDSKPESLFNPFAVIKPAHGRRRRSYRRRRFLRK